MADKKTVVNIEGRELTLTNLEKVLYPGSGFTKAQVIDYYARIAAVLLPHLRDRPLTMKRFPEGVRGFHFYEKNCPAHRPGWVTCSSPCWRASRSCRRSPPCASSRPGSWSPGRRAGCAGLPSTPLATAQRPITRGILPTCLPPPTPCWPRSSTT